jgi:hypothetical protein
LTFWDNKKAFVNGTDFRVAIPGIKTDHSLPELYFRGSIDPNPQHDNVDPNIDWENCRPEFVWEVGLIVPKEWWRKACEINRTLAQVVTETDSDYGCKRLVIARLPRSELDIYLRPFHDGGPDMNEVKKRREQMMRRGWDWDQFTAMHKYFTVTISPLLGVACA